VYPGDFERRGLVRSTSGTTYTALPGAETQYVVGGARLVYRDAVRSPTTGIDRDQRLTIGLTDLIQSTSATLDLYTGELVETSNYYPNGARESYRGSTSGERVAPEPMGFTGKEADEEVGLVYFGQRYLLAHLGRWASPDPLQVHAVGGGEALNGYHYVSGNVLQGRDPLGLDGQEAQKDGTIVGDSVADDRQFGMVEWVGLSDPGDGSVVAEADLSNGARVEVREGVHTHDLGEDTSMAFGYERDGASDVRFVQVVETTVVGRRSASRVGDSRWTFELADGSDLTQRFQRLAYVGEYRCTEAALVGPEGRLIDDHPTDPDVDFGSVLPTPGGGGAVLYDRPNAIEAARRVMGEMRGSERELDLLVVNHTFSTYVFEGDSPEPTARILWTVTTRAEWNSEGLLVVTDSVSVASVRGDVSMSPAESREVQRRLAVDAR
jgi:RHS repeat-associated protein